MTKKSIEIRPSPFLAQSLLLITHLTHHLIGEEYRPSMTQESTEYQYVLLESLSKTREQTEKELTAKINDAL
jgi:hypothetical protein